MKSVITNISNQLDNIIKLCLLFEKYPTLERVGLDGEVEADDNDLTFRGEFIINHQVYGGFYNTISYVQNSATNTAMVQLEDDLDDTDRDDLYDLLYSMAVELGIDPEIQIAFERNETLLIKDLIEMNSKIFKYITSKL